MRFFNITFFAVLFYLFSLPVDLSAQITLGHNNDETAPLVSPDMMTYNSGMDLYEFTVTGGPGYCRLMPSSLPFTFFFMTPIPVTIFFYPSGPLIDCSGFSGDLPITDVPHGTTSLIMNFTDGANHTMYVTSDEVLPVELISFSVKNIGDNVLLRWNTATEVDNYGFEIERSVIPSPASRGNMPAETAGNLLTRQWQNIGFVNGSGNSNSSKEYTFTDTNPPYGNKLSYRLKQINTGGSYEYSEEIEIEIIPTKFELSQNYPNPFNPTTKIKYSLPTVSGHQNACLKIYDILGREVYTLVNSKYEPGRYLIEFDASQLASGVYLYRLTYGDFSQTKKMILLR